MPMADVGTLEPDVDWRRTLAFKRNNQKVSSISEELGYASVANFSRAFRRWYSCTPSDYIKVTQEAASHGPAKEANPEPFIIKT